MPVLVVHLFESPPRALAGNVPAVLGQMPKLQVLDLFGNMFAVQSVIPRPMLTLPAAEKQKAPTSLQVHV